MKIKPLKQINRPKHINKSTLLIALARLNYLEIIKRVIMIYDTPSFNK
jgi:hypothetical protein